MGKKFCKSKIIILTLILSYIVGLFPMSSSEVHASTVSPYGMDDCGRTASNRTDDPSGIPPKNAKGFELNKDLWYVWGIQAYGSPEDVSANDFVNGYQTNANDPNSAVMGDSHGRFSYGGACGEWRYVGFDVNGDRFINIYLPNDVDGSHNNSQKRWVYRPWEHGFFSGSVGGVYGTTRPSDSVNGRIQQAVAESINFTVKNGINLSDGSRGPIDAPWEYAHIDQIPNMRSPGSLSMYQKNKYAKSGYFYQSFEFKKVQEREPVPVNATITVKDDPIDLKHFKGQDTVKFEVTVTGVLKDENYINDEHESFLHYTRNDIRDWKITLSSSQFSPQTIDEIEPVDNNGTATFEVEVPISAVQSTKNLLLTATATANLFNGIPISGNTNGVANFLVPADFFKLKSDFVVNDSITFKNTGEFTQNMVAYQDASIGVFDTYSIKIIEAGGDSKTLTYPRSSFSQSTVNTEIYDFIKARFSAQDVTLEIMKNFSIEQSVSNSQTGDRDTAYGSIHVKQWSKNDPAIQPYPCPFPDGCDGQAILSPPTIVERLTPAASIPDKWYDVVGFPATDNTVGWASRTVQVDGAEVDPTLFFSGQWVSGIGTYGLRHVFVEWTSPKGIRSSFSTWTVIYDTKPRVQLKFNGLFKQNRKMVATNTSAAANDTFVSDRYPLIYTFVFDPEHGGDDTSLRIRTNSDMEKVFMYKKPGKYALSLRATNSLGRVSDPYTVEFEILPDEKPALVLHPFDAQVARGQNVRLNYDVQSIDGDQIATKWVKLWYDSNNDGSFDQLVQTYTDPGLASITPPAGKIGNFMLEAFAQESTLQETLPEFMTPSDSQTQTVKRYFEVSNYQPISDLYVDKPLNRPNVDVFFMLDRAMSQARLDYMNGNEVTNTNKLLNINVMPAVDTWDMKTYTYSTPASTSRYTGGSYPSSSVSYSSGGYSGTLNLSSASNSPYSRDEGSYQYRNVSSTESRSFSASCSNTVRSNVITGYSSNTSACPGSYSISQDGYSGSIPRTGESGGGLSCDESSGWCTQTWTAYYSGTLSKTTTTQERYWVPRWVSYNDYTGYYSGTIYKDVRQSYNNSFFRTISDKYVVYMSDGSISQLPDLQMVLNQNTAKLICVGTSSMTGQIPCDTFIANNGRTADKLVDDVVKYIGQKSPANPRYYRMIGESITTYKASTDIENDPIVTEQFKIWWDPGWFGSAGGFDNSEGPSTGIASSYNAASWGSYQSKVSFNKPGKYLLIRRIQDRPSSDPRFSNYNFWSNESTVEVIVHRKPIADVTLDYDFDPSQNNYRTNWIDESYDLDHEFNRPDKGIVQRTLSLKNNLTGQLLYSIPARLYPGSYTYTYAAKDVEGAWSDPVIKSFVLSNQADVQLDADLRTELSSFSLSSVPAGENLRLYNLWTRYPYSLYLKINFASVSQTLPYYSGTKSGNDINWYDRIIRIPDTTLDGNYTYRVDAIGSSGGSNAYKAWPVKVFTPINLTGGVISYNTGSSASQIITKDPYTLTASTTKYPTSVSVTLFKGTAYQRTISLNGSQVGSNKNWSYLISSMYIVPDGTYTFEWKATNPSGKYEVYSKNIRVINNRPPTAGFAWTPTLIFEGDTMTFQHQVSDPDKDSLSVRYDITNPNNQNSVFTYTVNYPYPSSGGPTYKATLPGTYTVKQTVNDGKAPPVYLTKTFYVKPLSIAGFVSHTAQWENRRKAYNQMKSGTDDNPWTQTKFLAGEKFDLSAITSDTTGSATVANSVKVTMLETGDSINLSKINGTLWTGSLWKDSYENLSFGTYNFRFQVQYSNGTVKTVAKPITVDQTVDDYFELIRTK